ncbi:MAG: endolytic transglycosylase MltG [Pseudomonadota bacterium]
MKKLFLRLTFVFLLVMSILVIYSYTEYQRFLQTNIAVSEIQTELEILSGDTVNLLAERLQQQGIIDNALLFKVMARISKQSQIKVGLYDINSSMTPQILLKHLISGKVKQFSVTFIEGWRFKEWRTHLDGIQEIEKTLSGFSDKEIMKLLGEPDLHPEGMFFPDTYAFENNTKDITILKMARERMKQFIQKEWPNRSESLPYDTPYEALIMASIVEKETGAPEERTKIAGVFVSRLEKNMRLETDPTVIYGIGDNFDGDIKRKHLREYTPYNTYRIKGLPPTPIAMPGGESIKAALHPAIGDYLFFVSKGDGTHQFSTNLNDHNKAVRKYQLRKTNP